MLALPATPNSETMDSGPRGRSQSASALASITSPRDVESGDGALRGRSRTELDEVQEYAILPDNIPSNDVLDPEVNERPAHLAEVARDAVFVGVLCSLCFIILEMSNIGRYVTYLLTPPANRISWPPITSPEEYLI